MGKLRGLMKLWMAMVWVGLALNARATLWDFNDQDLSSVPAGFTATASYIGDGIGTMTVSLAGTTVNAPAGIDAGTALGWIDVANVFSQATFQVQGLDLSGEDAVRLSFALETDHIFELNETLKVYYKTGSSWVLKEELAPPSLGEWAAYSVDLSELAGKPNAGVRVVADTTVEVGKYLKIDNVQVVPEPSVWALVALGMGAVVFGARVKRLRAIKG